MSRNHITNATDAIKIEDLQARAIANKGLGIERVSRVEENRALAIERIAESKKDQALGTLNYAKTLKELESMDLAQLQSLLNLVEYIKERTQGQESPEEGLQAQPEALQPAPSEI